MDFRPARVAGRVLLILGLAVASGVTAMAAPKVPVDPGRAQAFVRDGLSEAIDIFRDERLSKDEATTRLRESLRARFDVNTIAGFALGVYRRRASQAELSDYRQIFEEMLVDSLTARIYSLGPQLVARGGELVKITDAVPVGRRDLLVRSHISPVNAQRVNVDWRLRMHDGSPKIIDVLILGVSQAQLYRQEFQSVIQRRGKGVAGLIEALKEKSGRTARR